MKSTRRFVLFGMIAASAINGKAFAEENVSDAEYRAQKKRQAECDVATSRAQSLAVALQDAKAKAATLEQQAAGAVPAAEDPATTTVAAATATDAPCNGCAIKRAMVDERGDTSQAVLDTAAGVRVISAHTETVRAGGTTSTRASDRATLAILREQGIESKLGDVDFFDAGPLGVRQLRTGDAALGGGSSALLLNPGATGTKYRLKWTGGQVAGVVVPIVGFVVGGSVALGVCFGAHNADGSSVCSSQDTTETNMTTTNTVVRF